MRLHAGPINMNPTYLGTGLSTVTEQVLQTTTTENSSACVPLESSDDPTLKTFSFAVNVVVVGSLCVSGVLCNILSVLTLQKDHHKLSMSILLQGLAVSDTMFLLYAFVYTSLRSVYPYNGHLEFIHRASPYIIAYLLPFGWMFQTTTIWIVMLVTIDRYVAVCHPFKANRWCTLEKARMAILIAWIMSFLFNLPRFFYYHQQAFGSESCYSSSTFVAHIHMQSHFWARYRTIYHIFITMVFLFIIPLPILIILNVKLIKEIAQAKKRQLQLSGTQMERDTIAVTINLIAVVTVFIICETPDFIASIITLDFFKVDKLHLGYFLCIKEFLLILNASTNFYIYCLFYSKFRLLLKRLLCARFLTKESLFSDTEKDSKRMSKTGASLTNTPAHCVRLLSDLNLNNTTTV